jgi:hypothetical protein
MQDQANHDTGTAAATSDTVHAALAALEASGADQFDPVQFRYLQAMAMRSQQQDSAVAQLLLKKTWRGLQAYQARFSEQRTAATSLLVQVTAARPELTENLERLFATCEFKAIRRLAQRQEKRDEVDSFAALTRQLQTATHDAESMPVSGSQELKAVRFFRDTLQRQHADKLVTHALIDAPESAGPLNPQKLALRSLAIMREVSPAYLTHFVSYMDTLFWLEKIDTLPPSK